jgi:hypothetical protein
MNAPRVGRRPKVQLICSTCANKCLPKEGNWFWSADSASQQHFLCRNCELTAAIKPRRAVGNR